MEKRISFNWSYTEPVLAPFGPCASKDCQGGKLFSPGFPLLQRFQKRRNLSAIVYSPVFFDTYKFQLDLQPVNDLHDQYCAGAKKVYGHKALTYFCSFCVVEVVCARVGFLRTFYLQCTHRSDATLLNYNFNKLMSMKIFQKAGVYAGVEPANYSLYIGTSLPFD